MSGKLEDALRASEVAGTELARAASRLALVAKQMQRAAASGDLAQRRVAGIRIREGALETVRCAEEAAASWPWSDAGEEEFLRGEFIDEVRAAAQEVGFDIHPYGESWSAFPALMQIEPKTRSVRLDRRRVRTIRPSVLVAQIERMRQAKSRQKPDQFLEILYSGYRAALGGQALESGVVHLGGGVRLVDAHLALTLLPDARKEYSVEAFARDLHQLNLSGLRKTRSGHVIHFSAATSTKSGAGVLTVIDDQSRPFQYYSIAFREAEI